MSTKEESKTEISETLIKQLRSLDRQIIALIKGTRKKTKPIRQTQRKENLKN